MVSKLLRQNGLASLGFLLLMVENIVMQLWNELGFLSKPNLLILIITLGIL